MKLLNQIDIVVIALYFGMTMLIAWWAARSRREKSSDYFLAGRNSGWFIIGASMFASNIGSEHLVGLGGSGNAGGMAVGHFEWLSCLVILVLGWLFVPFYLRSGVFTMPEFMERRYNRACRWYLTILSIISYVLTKISVGLVAGGVVIQALTGLDGWYSAAVVLIFTGVYTMLGGLRAVLYTDALQAAVFVVGATLLVVFGLQEVGGWTALRDSIPSDHFSMWRPASDPHFPWTGIVFGAPILGMWYWCTDQYIVQRVLAARNKGEAQTAAVFAGYLKILPVFLFVLPGMLALALTPQITATNPELAEKFAENPDLALPVIVQFVLPVGIRGLLLAALLAALMSSLSSTFNSCSTLITWDLYRQLHPEASERTLIRVGRIATSIVVLLSLLWIPFMKYISSQLYIYLQSVSGYLAPPIAACFLLGLFLPRLNGKGAITTMMVGFLLGATKLVLELMNGSENGLPADSIWEHVAKFNFLHFAAVLFVFCSAVLIVVSLLTDRPSREQLAGLTFQTARDGSSQPTLEQLAREESPAGRRTLNIALSVLLVLSVVVLWTIFA